MIQREFHSTNYKISIQWDTLNLKVFENDQLLETFSNRENLNDIKTNLSNGSDLRIQFRFSQYRPPTFNVSIDGTLLSGSSGHFLTVIYKLKYIAYAIGFVYLLAGIAMFTNEPSYYENWVVLIALSTGALLVLLADAFGRNPSIRKFQFYHFVTLLSTLVFLLDYEKTLPLIIGSITIFLGLFIPYKSIRLFEKTAGNMV